MTEGAERRRGQEKKKPRLLWFCFVRRWSARSLARSLARSPPNYCATFVSPCFPLPPMTFFLFFPCASPINDSSPSFVRRLVNRAILLCRRRTTARAIGFDADAEVLASFRDELCSVHRAIVEPPFR